MPRILIATRDLVLLTIIALKKTKIRRLMLNTVSIGTLPRLVAIVQGGVF